MVGGYRGKTAGMQPPSGLRPEVGGHQLGSVRPRPTNLGLGIQVVQWPASLVDSCA